MKKKIFTLLVLLAAVVTGAYAAVPDKVYYRVYDYSDGKLTYTDNEIAGTGVTEVTSATTEWTDGTYVVTATTTISSRITVTGTVNLIILDGATLTAEKGITVSDGNTLNIYMGNSSNSIQSTGQLNATAQDGMDYSAYPDVYEVRGAGIGGCLVLDEMAGSPIIEKLDCGNVNIHGGKINVQNESNCVAGIGGSEYGAGGNITIYYSQVTAYGNEYPSAIGAGYYGSGGTVAIYGGDVNAIVTHVYNTTTPGIGASLTVGKDVQVYALSGSKSADEDLSDDTNVAPEGGGQVTTFNNSMFTRYTGPAPAPVYSVSLKSGTEDAASWQGKAGEGAYQSLPLTGLEAGTAVSVKYNGTKKVKSVKAVSTGEQAPSNFTANDDGTVWTLTSMPEYSVELEIAYYDYSAATLTAAPTAKSNPTFTGVPLPLVDAGTATGGTLYYALGTADAAPTEASDWSTDVPTASAVGVYHVWYKVLGDATHNGIDPAGPLTVTVKADITAADITAPTAVENLKCTALPQALVVAGSVAGGIGTMQYRLGTDGTWSTDVPTATDKGDYTVYYKVEGDSLHNDYVPAEGIAVTIGEGAEMAAQLTVTGNGGTSCTAMLLDAATYQPLASGVKVGEKFILSIVKEDGYDFNFNVNGASTTEFTAEEYQAYYNYAKDNDIYVSLNTSLFWVTMPHVESGNLDLAVNFQQLKTFTILYQPATDCAMVTCKIERSVNNTSEVSYTAMQRGAKLGDGTDVWTMTMQAAFDPAKVAFVGSNIPTTDDEKSALATTLSNATLNDAAISQSADSWTNIESAKYLIIGGNAKVVTAAFVADANAVTTYKDFQVDEATTTGGVTYQLAVCVTDDAGNVTAAGSVKAPAAPTTAPQGKVFGGWRGMHYDNGRLIERIFEANDDNDIKVVGNVTFAAVWNPIQVTTTFALNGGANFDGSKTVDYGQKLSLSNEPKRSGLVFDKWTVAKAVNESGVLFSKGSQFDMNTPLTANLGLMAQWKHVHQYTCYTISKFGSALAAYQKYNGALHIAVCGCNDVEIVGHEFNPAGKCACGFQKASEKVQCDIEYGKLEGTTFSKFANGFPEFATRGQEVTVEAFHNWGDLEFKTWQYSTDGGQTWYDLAAFEIVGFLIPCNMTVRALYVNPVHTPTIELASSEGTDQTVYQGQTYKMGNILYKMNYKLPDGYKLLDAGIRMGDNGGISYYFQQTVKYSYDNESKGIIAGLNVGLHALSMAIGEGFDPVDFVNMEKASFDKAYEIKYLEREENVMVQEKMSAATLAKKMYEGIPINVEKYEPIYWDAKAPTKGLFGSMTTMPKLRFAQRNNGNHYIYGIAYMRYKTPAGEMKVLYTDAIAPTVNNPNAYTKKEEQASGARQMTRDLDETTAAARKAPKREPELQAETLDLSTVLAPQTQLVVYVNGEYSGQLSDTYGYGETVSLTAPTLDGKQFSYWTTNDGAVISTSAALTLTMNANTTLQAVYSAEQKSATPAITSATRTNDGTAIVLQAIAQGTLDGAGFVYSTTNDMPEINADGVTNVEAVKYSSMGSEMPASVLDRNNCWNAQITPDDANAVYHVRAYATVGGTTTYSAVKDVKLADLKSGIMMVANLQAFNSELDDVLAGLQGVEVEQHFPVTAHLADGAYWSTFYTDDSNYQAPEGTEVYAIGLNGSTMTVKKIADRIVPSGQGVVLKMATTATATTTTINMTKTTAAGSGNFTSNSLNGTMERKNKEDLGTGTIYVLFYQESAGAGFYKLADDGYLDANKAYLQTAASSREYYLFDETTAISAPLVNSEERIVNSEVYDLQGRRVKNAAKGVYIVNGRKVVVR